MANVPSPSSNTVDPPPPPGTPWGSGAINPPGWWTGWDPNQFPAQFNVPVPQPANPPLPTGSTKGTLPQQPVMPAATDMLSQFMTPETFEWFSGFGLEGLAPTANVLSSAMGSATGLLKEHHGAKWTDYSTQAKIAAEAENQRVNREHLANLQSQAAGNIIGNLGAIDSPFFNMFGLGSPGGTGGGAGGGGAGGGTYNPSYPEQNASAWSSAVIPEDVFRGGGTGYQTQNPNYLPVASLGPDWLTQGHPFRDDPIYGQQNLSIPTNWLSALGLAPDDPANPGASRAQVESWFKQHPGIIPTAGGGGWQIPNPDYSLEAALALEQDPHNLQGQYPKYLNLPEQYLSEWGLVPTPPTAPLGTPSDQFSMASMSSPLGGGMMGGGMMGGGMMGGGMMAPSSAGGGAQPNMLANLMGGAAMGRAQPISASLLAGGANPFASPIQSLAGMVGASPQQVGVPGMAGNPMAAANQAAANQGFYGSRNMLDTAASGMLGAAGMRAAGNLGKQYTGQMGNLYGMQAPFASTAGQIGGLIPKAIGTVLGGTGNIS